MSARGLLVAAVEPGMPAAAPSRHRRRGRPISPGRSRRWRAALLAVGLFAAGSSWAQTHPRVVSINLCTDQLVLALADPEQILGLSPFARDPARSWAAAQAERYPLLSGTAEEVLAVKPDLVLAGRYTKRATRELLRAQRLRIEEFAPARSVADAQGQIRRMAELLGHPERGEAAITAIDRAVARAHAVVAGRSLDVLPIFRRGWASGEGTLLGSMLTAVGLRVVGGPGRVAAGGGFVSLEQIVALRPDRLLVSNASRSPEDQGAALLQHTALEALYPPERRIVLSESLTACGGPMLAEALDRLAGALRATR